MMASQLPTLFTKHGLPAAAAALAAVSTFSVTLMDEDDVVHPPHYPWRHQGYFSSFDHAALRRGYQVYREVCASCHSLHYIRFRELVGVTHTKEEVKQMAQDVDVLDGPNDQGEMFERPGKPYDVIPSPYPNKEAGRAANGGAYPPDLSLMVKARHNGADYVFALLTGYCDAPAGKEMMPGLHYNPYFPGGAISMPPPLNDGGVEYEDGTEATISQQARDIAQFLSWTAEPESEERKKNACKYMVVLAFMALSVGYYKRWKWAPLKTRQIAYVKGVGGAAL